MSTPALERERPRILVVEDDDSVRALIAVTLEMAGFQVLEARDGEAALRLAVIEPPDLVSIDLMMPGMDGWELSDRLRAGEHTATVRQLIVSARPPEDIQRGAREHAIDAWLAKPFDFARLVERVYEILELPAQAPPVDE